MLITTPTHAPDTPAILFEGQTITYGQFEAQINRIGNALAAAGIKPGERAAYVGRNTAAYFLLLYGAMKAGIVLVPVNWRLAPPEICAIVADSRARVLVLGREYTGEAAYANLPGMDLILAAEDAPAAWPSLQDWCSDCPATPPAHRAAPADIALQLYTSGTTGQPKGVMLSHANLAHALFAARTHDLGWNQWCTADSAVQAMPVSHIGGTGWGIVILFNGAACHIQRQFDLDVTFDVIAQHRPTRLFLVPAALQMLVRHPRARQADFSSLNHVCYGASPMPLPLLRECMGVMNRPFVQFYGMTETSGTIVALPAADHAAALTSPDAEYRLRAAGRALPWVELRIVDANGEEAPRGAVGELVTRSPANMAGYWQKPEETARTIAPDGWLHTGDAGFMDADGYVFIHDRVKDMIISGGENVYPGEVEVVLAEHPAVADVAVIGVPDPRWGEAVKAIVVLRPDQDVSAAALIAWSRTRIGGFKVPGSVEFVDALPRNASGKLLKRVLREPYWKGAPRQV